MILQVNNLTKNFGGVRAVKGTSFFCKEGQITALVGANGAGKTTIFNLINGFLKIDGGEILFRGQSIAKLPAWRIAQLGIGRLFQDGRLFGKLTVCENIMSALTKKNQEGVYRSLFRRRANQTEERVLLNRTVELLDFVGLAEKANSRAEDLSYGQQKLVAIARLLAADADLILLDEPTAGVNPTRITQLLDVLHKLAQNGKTILLIEHNMQVVCEIADLAHFLENGKVIASAKPKELLRDEKIRASYIGLI